MKNTLAKSPLRILHLEDNPRDRELVAETLAASGLDCQFTYAQTQVVFEAALLRGGLDLILGDFTLPSYNGDAALAAAHRGLPEVPFIFFSGTIGEDRAVTSLKRGATDYVLKQRLNRLVPAVERALAEAQEHRKRQEAEESLRASEEKYRGFFQSSLDAIMTLEPPSWRFTAGNPATVKMFGAENEEEFISHGPGELSPERQPDGRASAEKSKEMIETAMREGSQFFEWTHRRIGGEEFPADVLLTRMEQRGKVILQATVRDITERKRTEEAIRDSEKRFRSLAEATSQIIWSTDGHGQVCGPMPSWQAYTGQTDEEVRGSGWSDALHPDDLPRTIAIWTNAVAGKTGYETEYRMRRHDGDYRHFAARGAPVVADDGSIREWVGTCSDITERKQAEARLTQEHDLSEAILNNMPGLFYLITEQGRFLRWNRQLETVSGYSGEEIARMHPLDIFPAEHKGLVTEQILQVFKTGRGSVEANLLTKQGEQLPFCFTGGTVIVDGQPCLAGTGIDITERKRAEEALRGSQQLLAGIINAMPVRVFWKDENLVYLGCNAAFARDAGFADPKDIIGKDDCQMGWHDRAEQYRADDRQVIESGGSKLLIEEPLTTPQGKVAILTSKIPLRNSKGEISGVLGTYMDITARKRAEEGQARLATAVEQAAETIVITEPNGTILYANPAFEKITGYTRKEAIGQNPRILKSGKHDAEFYRRMWAVLSAGQVWSGHLINKRKDGTLYEEDANISPVLDAAGKIVNYVAVKRDVTEQKKLEAQMLRSQRLESIGTLAGGVAHDLNNALAPIMMASELLRLEFPDTGSSYLDLIQAGAKRGADMVKQLLTFAKGAEGERLLVQPKHLLKEMEKLINSTFLKNIQLRTQYAKDLWTILGDATQLHQVLLNLCVNARDAMPEGGTLTLEAENKELDATYARNVPEAKPGRYVEWRVTDTGTGIPPEVLNRLFEPFYTTKGPDKGTGLGLSTTLGIVKSHGGFIRVYSQPGQGSTFAVYLPAYDIGAGDTALLTKTEMTFHGDGETILVVDDEVAVRNILRDVLTKLNFKVLTASDGTAALNQVTEQPAELRAVITDLHMPHMDGLSFVRVLKGRLSQTGIIVVSSPLNEREMNEFKQLGVHAVLEKPFSQEKLVAALKTVFAK